LSGSTKSSELSDGLEAAPNIDRNPEPVPPDLGSDSDYPLAVKMMFNYSVESHADRILSAMAKEMVPVYNAVPEEGATLNRCTPHHNQQFISLSMLFPFSAPPTTTTSPICEVLHALHSK
jgi:hypothetical protein